MQRILFLSSVYPRSYDPTRGTYCHATCKALAEKHSVRVVSPQSWLERLRQPSASDERLDREVGRIEYPCYYYPPGILHSTYGWWMWNSIKRPLLRIAREFQPQGIISYWADPDGTTAVRLGQRLGLPTGIMVGGSDVLLLTRNSSRRKVIAATLNSADAVLAVSHNIRERTIKIGVDSQKVHVVHRGVDATFCPGDQAEARWKIGMPLDREMVLWVGRMVPVKGLEVLLEAARQLAPSHPRLLLTLVGDGASRKPTERLARELHIEGHVRFAGSIPPEDLPDWYRAADLTVLSSHSEGIPNVLRESLACGTPYVATRVGGIVELCDHPAIRLVSPRDPIALADGIRAALAAPQRIPGDLIERGWNRPSDELITLLTAARPAFSAIS